MDNRARAIWAFVITSLAVFMASLDNLVVTTALPVIRQSLGASLAELEWVVNGYTLTFAVLLLTGAALGDRFGRRRVFILGLATFTIGSTAAALAPSSGILIAARALQGLGGAIITPLSLTILSNAVPAGRRGLALGAWGAVAGLAIALGPLVGGAIVEGLEWQWIFWLNVPIGIAVVVLALARLPESHGPDAPLDLVGLGLASGGLLALVWALVNGNADGWTSAGILAALGIAAVLLPLFIAWEARTAQPMLPLKLLRSRQSAAANVVSLLMSFGMFGSVFLLAQFFQVVQHYTPLQAGLRTLPWTAMPLVAAPIAGVLSDRIGGRPLLVTGLGLMAAGLGWIAVVTSPTVDYIALVPAFVLNGVGMGFFFAPTANVVLAAVRPEEEGKASGANNAIREIGGVLGVAALASVFSANGGYASGTTFVAGLQPAIALGAVVVAAGSLVALAIPGRRALALVRQRVAGLEYVEGLELERVPVRVG